MKAAFIKLFTLAMIAYPTLSQAEIFNVECKSTSGLSTYQLFLDTEAQIGEIYYSFMDQIIVYRVKLGSKSNKSIGGYATFSHSYSGETKGNPFTFNYNPKLNKYTENNLTAYCN